jgi:hypothetical protein
VVHLPRQLLGLHLSLLRSAPAASKVVVQPVAAATTAGGVKAAAVIVAKEESDEDESEEEEEVDGDSSRDADTKRPQVGAGDDAVRT